MSEPTRRSLSRSPRTLFAVGAALLGAACLALLLTAPRGEAAYPGKPGKIAFEANPGGASDEEILVINPDGSVPTRLTFNVLGNVEDDENPAFSGKGDRIVWDGDTDAGGGTDREIFLMNADGTAQAQLTPSSSTMGGDDLNAAISWDGTKIVFQRPDTIGGDVEIFLMDAGGGGVTQLTFNTVFDANPVFSRDGKTIYFESELDDQVNFLSEIWKMNVDGSGLTQLTSGPGFASAPDLSPDDRRIVFESDRAFPGVQDNVYVMNADGSGVTQLTSLVGPLNRPVFSPDSSQIAFDLNPGGPNSAIYTMNADGSGMTSLTSGVEDSDSADWQPIPVKCKGKQATMVGTAGKDKLLGTKEKDVIAGLGGKDKIKGKGGKDRLCGGKGNDKLSGGSGKDKLVGGKGNDDLSGGKGDDSEKQ